MLLPYMLEKPKVGCAHYQVLSLQVVDNAELYKSSVNYTLMFINNSHC